MITQRQRLRIKREMAGEKPTIWIGKNGITEEVVKEVSNQLDKNQLAKIKVLKSALKSDNAIDSLARVLTEKTDSILIDVRGNNLIIYKVERKTEKIA